MQIVIGCDNAAVSLKNIIVKLLETKGVEVEDKGCFTSEDPINYPLVAKKVCDSIIESGYTKRGILICGTGIGMAMTANKFKGIRAAVCHDIFSTQRSILSNNANTLCMGALVIGKKTCETITRLWLSLTFDETSHSAKNVQMIKDIEAAE